MCHYCEDENNIYYFEGEFYISIPYNDQKDRIDMSINYCPMCGIELLEEEDEE